MNPLHSVRFHGASQLFTPCVLTGSILILPYPMMMPRYSTSGALNVHFSGLR